MKRLFIIISAFVLINAGFLRAQNSLKRIALPAYPKTEKVNVTDRYFDTLINDPYRWLENDSSARTKKWVQLQNQFTDHYLSQIPVREKIRDYLATAWNYARETPSRRIGEYYFFTRNNGLQNQPVWFLKKGLNGPEKELLDPNTLSPDGTAAVTMLDPSGDNRYIVYAVAQAGSDWNTIYILDIATGKKLKDEIEGIKFPRVAWKGNGFYYTRYEAPSATVYNQVYYHRLGDDQQQDRLIYEDKTNPKLSLGVFVTEDERFLVITALPGSFLGFKLTTSTGNALLYQDLSVPGSSVKELVKGYEYHNSIITNVADQLLLQTDAGAPNGKLVLVDPGQPDPANWKTIIPEQKESLVNTDIGGGYIWTSYLKDAHSLINQYTYGGQRIRDVALPGIGTAAGFEAGRGDTLLFYTFTNAVTPTAIYRYSIASGESTLYTKPGISINSAGYETKQAFCTSKDGTKVPVFIVHKKGLQQDGNNPTFMLGHGGFKRNLVPFFHPAIMMFLENGGVYAQAVLRGGNEYGEAWHRAGMRENKQHVFDDFIAVAEYLIHEKYTSPSKIAIAGRSTGAVLVAACINQRPDLFRAALPDVGMLDMLRYHKFTIGHTWTGEYGSSDHKEQFEYLVKYSPLHNIRTGKQYPAVFITTADHDNTVVPAHSFKYAATLQEKQQGQQPVLIRIYQNIGHGPGKPASKQIEEAVDAWSFIFQNLGMDWLLPGL